MPDEQTVAAVDCAAEGQPVLAFAKEYRFLSNFWPCRVFNGHWYPSVEHAYQAAKCLHKRDEVTIRNADSASMAKRMGKSVELRPDWAKIKLEVMADLLWQKFVLNPELRARLLATGHVDIIEGNTWGDTYWGKCGGVGHNHLGKLIMLMRDVARHIVENTYAPAEVVNSDGRESRESAG